MNRCIGQEACECTCLQSMGVTECVSTFAGNFKSRAMDMSTEVCEESRWVNLEC